MTCHDVMSMHFAEYHSSSAALGSCDFYSYRFLTQITVQSHRGRATNKSGNNTQACTSTTKSQTPRHKVVEGERTISPGTIVAAWLDKYEEWPQLGD